MSAAIPWASRPKDPLANLANEHVSLLRGLITMLDQIEQWETGTADAESARVARLRDGMTRLLVSHGLRPTACLSTPVDLRYHEVVATRPLADGDEPDHIVSIIQTGWELMGLGERVTLRLAKVVVAVNNEEPPSVQEKTNE